MSEQEIPIVDLALQAGFMLSTAHGQGINRMMPVSDRATLQKFAELVGATLERQMADARMESGAKLQSLSLQLSSSQEQLKVAGDALVEAGLELAAVRGELNDERRKVEEYNLEWNGLRQQINTLRGELEQTRQDLNSAALVVNTAVDYVERSSGQNIDSWPEFQFLQSAVKRFQKTLQQPHPHAGGEGEGK